MKPRASTPMTLSALTPSNRSANSSTARPNDLPSPSNGVMSRKLTPLVGKSSMSRTTSVIQWPFDAIRHHATCGSAGATLLLARPGRMCEQRFRCALGGRQHDLVGGGIRAHPDCVAAGGGRSAEDQPLELRPRGVRTPIHPVARLA